MKMGEHSDCAFCILTRVQHSGLLLKKSFALHSTKWSKRFFIVKEGFLLYYPESEKKTFVKRGYLNIHPKGVIPLGGCVIEPAADLGQDYMIWIKNDDFINGNLSLAVENKYDQDKWVEVLREAARITWDNTRMGESIIRDLETQGLQLNKEKQSYVEKLHVETIALRDEIDKNLELERLNAALDEEKKRLENMIKEFQKEHVNMKTEYEETITAMKMVQQDKKALEDTTEMLMENLSDLEKEKKKILGNLKESEKKNTHLSQATQSLKQELQEIEEDTKFLLAEKNEIERRLKENEVRAQVLEEEKELICQHSSELLSSLNDLVAQRGLAEADLRLEVSARLEAERQLQSAHTSVQNLEGALALVDVPGDGISDSLRSKILPDVKKLRKFFEQIAEEAKIDANMPVIMKNSVYAKKAIAKRAIAQQIEQSRMEKAKTLGGLQNLDAESPLVENESTSTSGAPNLPLVSEEERL
ncbi:pleckstrin homology domain-containing family D member 1-like isoform X2 [Hetaerina americana]|uniref:pleckstrin homology domain-containing family D member 1-like isoform X2 n=1 Tax=Hetaerina americana TaxID=62018 RepID=UPI003A7F4D67